MNAALRAVVNPSLTPDDRALLSELAGAHVRFDEPMSRHTTLKIGGPADAWFAPAAIDELQAVVAA